MTNLRNSLSICALGLVSILPEVTFAAPATYSGLVNLIVEIINILIPTLFAILFVYFVWKVIDSWVIGAGDQMKREEGRKYASAAVLMFVLMISTWGIVAMLRSSFFE